MHGPFHHVTQNEKDLCEVCMAQRAENERLRKGLAAALQHGPEAPIDVDRWLEARAEIERLRAAIATAETMVSDLIEEFHDYEEPEHVQSERNRLRAIEHHLAGTLIDAP